MHKCFLAGGFAWGVPVGGFVGTVVDGEPVGELDGDVEGAADSSAIMDKDASTVYVSTIECQNDTILLTNQMHVLWKVSGVHFAWSSSR